MPTTAGPFLPSVTMAITMGTLMSIVVLGLIVPGTAAAEFPKRFTNSVGMTMVGIEPGSYVMGYSKTPLPADLVDGSPYRINGDFDEHPYHPVAITKPFLLSATEVTNIQYEAFDPSHRQLRGKDGFSFDDNEAVLFVSWHEAVAYTEWLSRMEKLTYRLPTEAEWEYAARDGTTTYFYTGDSLPQEYLKNQVNSWWPDPERSKASDNPRLFVGTTPPNRLGLYDMHGNVEEWCSDWYGPYSANATSAPAENPTGPPVGDFRVTRGGSHSTEVYYLRSANRLGALPDEKSWLIGFRVLVELPSSDRLANSSGPAVEADAAVDGVDKSTKGSATHKIHVNGHLRSQPTESSPRTDRKPIVPPPTEPDSETPYFLGPIQYVNITDSSPIQAPPYAHHNHDPALQPLSDGRVLAIWYSTATEPGRELCVVSATYDPSRAEWSAASMFWDAPDRNDHAPALFLDTRTDTLWHFNGHSAAGTWGNLAVIARRSTDGGRTWSTASLILPEHGLAHQPVESVITAFGDDGSHLPPSLAGSSGMILPCDNVTTGSGGTRLYLSTDEGRTWKWTGSDASGIHGTVVRLTNGSLLMVGRGNDIDGRMAMSLSNDLGASWSHRASPFQGIGGGQRAVLLRLREGLLVFVGFATNPELFQTASGNRFNGTGLYTAISEDDGNSWTHFRLVTDNNPVPRQVQALDGDLFTLSRTSAEPDGYMAVKQAVRDSLVHIISSRQHYQMNVAWLRSLPDW